ncbi:rRNA maturation RNase YbeY [candidate division KSB1 bacterium]|nr:rRNA maturation RNase YbeY [candidate division KSB1 bacterium]
MRDVITMENPFGYVDLKESAILRLVKWMLGCAKQPPWRVTVVFVNDEYMTDLNERFLHKSGTTDVISFNLSDAKNAEGEIYISIDTARMNSQYFGVTLEDELYRLVAHGVYHLLDYDDTTEEGKRLMTALENKALEYIYSAVDI